MRLNGREIKEILAGEYALGALHGGTKARMEVLMRSDPELQRQVIEWQEELSPLADATPEVTPPPGILQQLQAKLKPTHQVADLHWWQGLGFWRPFGVASAALALLLGSYLAFLTSRPQPVTALEPDYIAVLQDDAANPALVVTVYHDALRIAIEPLTTLSTSPNETLKLWAVERDTGIVRTLVPTVTGSTPQDVRLVVDTWHLIMGAESLILSREPVGAAPETLAGPVLFSGPCVNLKPMRST